MGLTVVPATGKGAETYLRNSDAAKYPQGFACVGPSNFVQTLEIAKHLEDFLTEFEVKEDDIFCVSFPRSGKKYTKPQLNS